MQNLTRKYYNSSDQLLRQDLIQMVQMGNVLVRPASEITFRRHLVTRTTVSGDISVRTVSYIEVSGNFDSIETSSGNFLQCEWTSPPARCGMTDLPVVGEAV